MLATKEHFLQWESDYAKICEEISKFPAGYMIEEGYSLYHVIDGKKISITHDIDTQRLLCRKAFLKPIKKFFDYNRKLSIVITENLKRLILLILLRNWRLYIEIDHCLIFTMRLL